MNWPGEEYRNTLLHPDHLVNGGVGLDQLQVGIDAGHIQEAAIGQEPFSKNLTHG